MSSNTSVIHNPLPSWNDTLPRARILEFLAAVTEPGGEAFVEPVNRIATFDNDGTLWVEHPVLVQAQFALNRFRGLAQEDPSLLTNEALRQVADGDDTALARLGFTDLESIVYASHANVSLDELSAAIDAWLATAVHPSSGRPVLSCVYQPMLELLALLRAHEFTCFIVTGGGATFVRRFAHAAYGIPPHQVIGSSLGIDIRLEDGDVTLLTEPRLRSFNDREQKVVNIVHHVGQRPILAAGNADGDLATFRYTAGGPGRSLRLLLHHDDAEREAAYDRDFALSPLREALDVAEIEGTQVISMRRDWSNVFLA